MVESSRVVTEEGGFLDWCHASNLIAFAYETHRSASEIYTIRPDGSDRRCVTCDTPEFGNTKARGIRSNRGRRYKSAPAWHPSCEFMVVQVGSNDFRPTIWERPPFGIHNELWIVAADGSWAEQLVPVEKGEGVMSPHFSDLGTRLVWAARKPTGKKVGQTRIDPTPLSESPWTGWYLSVTDFVRPHGGPSVLSNPVESLRKHTGFFRPSALTGDTLWFTRTWKERKMADKLQRSNLDGSNDETLYDSRNTWEDQGEPSPWGTLLTFRSSQPYAWRNPGSPMGHLHLELWALNHDREAIQLTHYDGKVNDSRRSLVEDYAWGPRGREIAVYVKQFTYGEKPRHAIEILRLNDEF
ncbi:hypothetical protein MK489_00270 [Myxococcota bacterium]|nr:hypothetical protein [Myxococcota bacterium]